MKEKLLDIKKKMQELINKNPDFLEKEKLKAKEEESKYKEKDIEIKKIKLEEVQKEKVIVQAILTSQKHQKDRDIHTSELEKQMIADYTIHKDIYHIDEKQVDTVINAVNLNTEHSSNNSIHFDNKQQKIKVLDLLDKDNTIVIQGGGGPGKAEKDTDHSNLKNIDWSKAGHIIDTNILPDTDNSYSLGSTAFGFTETHSKKIFAIDGITANATITASSGIAFGSVDETSSINVISEGGIAGGYTNDNGSITIDVDAKGSIAHGFVEGVGGEITSTAEGGFAQGKAKNATILSEGTGSFARGFALFNDISAIGTGSFAQGLATGNDILASGTCSFAQGSAQAGDITASALNSAQFGPGTNAEADSLQVGTTMRLKGTTGSPTSDLHNGDMWVDSDGDVWIRTGGVSLNMSDAHNIS